MAMEIDEVIDEIKSIVTVNTEKQAEALNWAVNYMTLLKSALNDYKDRKVEKVAMLEELKKEMNPIKECEYQIYGKEHWNFVGKCQNVIQEKINALKENKDEKN